MTDFDAIPAETTPVLIAGGGPVGLTLAIVLGHYGVACTVIERNPTTTQHPKMDITNGRTMEIFRRLGLADQVHTAAVPSHLNLDVSWVSSLTGHEIYRFTYPSPDNARAAYREINDGTQPLEPDIRISQIVVEPLLRDIAAAMPQVAVHYGWTFNELIQDSDGVTASISHSETGEERSIRAAYLAGCDGGSSRVRRCLGIGLEGDANIRNRYSIHFRSKDKNVFEPWGPAWHYQSPIHGTLISQDGDERFTLHSYLKPGDDEETIDPYEMVRRFAGRDFDFELLQATSWKNNLLVAEKYRDRRGLLAGDATHQYIPTGGYGMNTGIGDAYDLGWKLAAVVNGWGGDGLLESYELERRPVGIRNRAGSKRHAEARLAIGDLWPDDSLLEDAGPSGESARDKLAAEIEKIGNAENESLGIEIGYGYAGSPVICQETGDDPPDNPLTYVPTTRPGFRPPAVYLADGTALFDLMGPGYTMFDFSGGADTAGLERAATAKGVPLTIAPINDDHAASLYEMPLVLLRPDQHVCWRGTEVPADPQGLLTVVTGR